MERNGSSIVAARGAYVRRKGGRPRGRSRGRRNVERADLFSGPGFNFQTGPRMARSRRASLESLAFLTIHVQQKPLYTIDRTKLRYLFKKQLGNTDVSGLRRIVLPKRDAESYLPTLETKQGISISMLDMDGMHEWQFKFRYWPNNSSKMYVFEGTGDFADAHDLSPGDSILLYRNIEDGRYIIEAKKENEFEPDNVAINGLHPADDMAFHEPAPPAAEVAFLEFHPLERLEDLVGYDATYDYEPAFLDDSPLVYQGDPIKLPHLDLNIPFEPFAEDDGGDF